MSPAVVRSAFESEEGALTGMTAGAECSFKKKEEIRILYHPMAKGMGWLPVVLLAIPRLSDRYRRSRADFPNGKANRKAKLPKTDAAIKQQHSTAEKVRREV